MLFQQIIVSLSLPWLLAVCSKPVTNLSNGFAVMMFRIYCTFLCYVVLSMCCVVLCCSFYYNFVLHVFVLSCVTWMLLLRCVVLHVFVVVCCTSWLFCIARLCVVMCRVTRLCCCVLHVYVLCCVVLRVFVVVCCTVMCCVERFYLCCVVKQMCEIPFGLGMDPWKLRQRSRNLNCRNKESLQTCPMWYC